MQGANKEFWKQLCEEAANENDPVKMLELTKQIGHLLAQKQDPLENKAHESTNQRGGSAMTVSVRLGKIESIGIDSIVWSNSETRFLVKFKDSSSDPTLTKEDAARSLRGQEGKPAAIPIEPPFFLGMDIMRGEFDGVLRTIPLFDVESITVL